MFERFTDPARQVVVVAQDEARKMFHDWIGSEHLLLGLVGTRGSLAGELLAELGVSAVGVRSHIELGDGGTQRQIPFLPQAVRALKAASAEADAMNHNWVGTEHLLLGLAADSESIASMILADLGPDSARVREHVLSRIDSRG